MRTAHVPYGQVHIPGRTFSVTPLYLEAAIELTKHRVAPNAEWSRRPPKVWGGSSGTLHSGGEEIANADDEALDVEQLRSR